MKRHTYLILAVIATIISMASCRDLDTDLANPNDSDFMFLTSTYTDQFKRVWQGIDVGYAFWQWEKVDWDSVYEADLPIFQAADERVAQGDTMSMDEYKKLWKSIIQPLCDHHMMLAVIEPYRGYITSFSPDRSRQDSADYHVEFTRKQHLSTIKTMLGTGELNAKLDIDSTLDDQGYKQYFITGFINEHIAYLYMSSFMINHNNPALNANLNKLYAEVKAQSQAGTLKGFILDTRNNGGGYAYYEQEIASLFTKKEVLVNYSYMKKDIGRYDYAAPRPNVITPDSTRFLCEMSDECPMVCLFDQNSASNGEEIPWTLSKMPGYASVGERTCGGMGGLLLGTYTPFCAGTFGNANITTSPSSGNYYCYMSLFANVDADTGKSPEGIGMIPQIEELLDTEAFFAGKRDNQLLRAIQRVETGK